ncbi:MarR family winged helix-turn-helix transcriptional regulator [Lactiplantibacillus daowaiensis]|uniref:MarR family winged helix-turn-helix transcriptional regulator n=1 Tax=Lactiplantibacillus daowaiensis TaxID=2559918 RepID=A0ABW1RYK0_9LACO|nr:MarR family winged helix-turn-helix transcriptional regulator [Lactiplantibacillus daowaiensis]
MHDEQVKLGFLIKQAHLKFEVARNEFYKTYEMTGPQVDVIEFLATQPDQRAPLNTIVTHLQVSYATTSGLVTRLVKKGFVQKCPAPNDKRSVQVQLVPCPQLDAIFAAEHVALSQVDQQLTVNFSTTEFDTFVRLLRKLNANHVTH